MIIDDLKLLNFRSYSTLNLKFNPKLNIIYGMNGAGKTNIVEAIYALSLTKSFRTNQDNLMIMKNKNVSKVEANIINNDRKNYQLILQNHEKKVKINNNKIEKLSDYVADIFMILFNPDDLKIIKESPALRRKFINIELSQLDKNYILYLNGYNKILKQRNIYLKEMYINGTLSKNYLDILTEKLVDYGLKIYEMRKKFINKVSQTISENYLKIFEYGDLSIKYISDYNEKKENILKKYNQYLKKDMLLGKTTFGIHRDDIEFNLDDDSLKDCGSEGQQKNAIIAFKLSEIDIVNEEKGYYPILIFDDLSSELDRKKINNILKMFDEKVQTFITTTSIDYFSEEILKKANIINVDKNNVEVN